MENTTQPLSSSLTLLNPSPDEKENHPPPFTDFHTWDIIHYFDTKFETFDQYLLYLQQHLSDWQPDPHFQHFHMAYVHYRTMNDHIDSIEKTLKTMEKTWDNLKGTMNCLTPVLHKKDSRTRSDPSLITLSHHPFPSLIPSPSPFPTILHYPIQALLLNHYQYHPHKDTMNENSVKPANTLLSMIMYFGPWDETITMDAPADVLSQKKTLPIQNQSQFQKHWNPGPHILATSPLPSARNAMHFT